MPLTTVPAVYKQLAAQLRLRAGIIGPPKVAVHTIDLALAGGIGWRDSEAIVFGNCTAPQAWIGMGTTVTKEDAVLSGYVFAELPGGDDSKADEVRDRAGVILDELVQQVRTDPNVNGAIPAATGRARIPPLLTAGAWSAWLPEENGVVIARVRIDWSLTWQARTG